MFSLSHIHDYLDLEKVILVILSVLCVEKIWIIMNLIREDPFDVEVLLTLLVKNSICTKYLQYIYTYENRSEIFQVIVQEQFEE